VTSIKSGPNTINDTQVAGMTHAILTNYQAWMAHTKQTYPNVDQLDVVLGLTYGTDRTTNNKENQILVKLLEKGFVAANLETRINAKLQHLAVALAKLQFPRNSLPEWVRDDFTENQLFWFATAMTAFYDEGI
jgi:Type II restriction endonuclease EcoO109I